MVRHDIGWAKPIVFSFFLFLSCSCHLHWIIQSVPYIPINWHMPKFIQFLHGPTTNDAHNPTAANPKDRSCWTLDLGFPLPLKREGSLTLMVDRSWDFTKGHPGLGRGLSHGNWIIDSETCLLVNLSQEYRIYHLVYMFYPWFQTHKVTLWHAILLLIFQ